MSGAISADCATVKTMQTILEIMRLWWQPLNALEALRQRASFWMAFACAWVAAFVYAAAAQSLAGYAMRSSSTDLIAGGTMGFVLLAARIATMLTLFIAAWYAPFNQWLGNRFGPRAKDWRTNYRAFTTCALAALCAALMVAMIPAVIIGWQARTFGGAAVAGFLLLILLMPIPIIVALTALALRVNFALSQGRAILVVILTLWSFTALLVLYQVAGLIIILALLMGWFLRARTN
jgi:hypothetical protein